MRIDTRAAGPLMWTGTSYRSQDGATRITPVVNPAAEQVAVTDQTRTLVVVRERASGTRATSAAVETVTPTVFERIRSLAVQWPLDFVAIELADSEPVQVTAGAARVTPLYLAHDAHVLAGSWDMADLAGYVRGINVREAARLLVYRPRYSTDTFFTGIWHLTERATAYFAGHLVIRYPEPALHLRPRDLSQDAAVIDAFTSTIDAVLDKRPLDPDRTLFHLTGGFDSGTIAARAAARWPGRLTTAALLIGGPGRGSQIRRRTEMRAVMSYAETDILIDAMEHQPLAADCLRTQGARISPAEEPLHHPFTLMARATAQSGATSVVTGLGGDEMVALSVEEYPDKKLPPISTAADLPWIGARTRAALEFADDGIAPPAQINSMTLLSLETTAPVLLREGLWPVHPFADPDMVALGEQLPYDWRMLKQLQRQHLASHGMSDDVTHPTARESFAEVVQHALTTQGVTLLKEMLDEGSLLFEEKLVDPDGITSAVHRLQSGTYGEDHDAKLLEVLTLHHATTAYC
ncbi:asparagine synthase-related protein [Promicromonospora alba]|uniref:Asparagine synthase-related protein n=1 Tax=Promicromonospora alba TaxID=1616110 RepID=A0ABV9HCJ0_9MICO